MVTILSALLFSGSFEPLGFWLLAPIGFSLLFTRLKRSNKPILTIFIFGLVSQGIILYWSGKYVGLLPWALLTLLQASYLIPAGYVYKKTENYWYLIASLLLADEIKSNFPFGGFGWTRIGYSQAVAPYLNLASLGGVAALSLIVLVIAIGIIQLSIRKFIFILLICFLPLGTNQIQKSSQSLRVAAVQGNTPKVGLDFNERAEAVFNLHLEKSKTINRSVDLIVWPENASDIDPYLTPGISAQLMELSEVKRAPLIIGAVLRSDNKLKNASIALDSMSTKSIYIKQHLTPFGEYIPLRRIAELVSPFAEGVKDFTPGEGYLVHKIGNIDIGPIICYEIIDDAMVREAASKSHALVVQTNSATFSGTAESAQQLNITRIRAVEHNRDILSVSTIGISAFIDNNGRVLQISKENVSEILYGQLRSIDSQTIADKLNGQSWIAIVGALLIIGRLRRRTH